MTKKLNKIIALGASMFMLGCHQTPKFIPETAPYRPDKINSDPAGGAYLSLEESMKQIYLPEGYHLELVASEPMVEEPVAICWDGDGRMYVAEMLTYMLDVDGSNENLPHSRIVRLEDTDGDGVMDKQTIFIDSLVLPRMMLSIDDKLVINETYSYNLWSYRDTDGDGVADEKKLVYQNATEDTRNLEHQPSGLVWNLDNWIYLSQDPVRYRFENDHFVADTFGQAPGGQWGLANDDYGRLYFSSAGGEVPALSFQQNPIYGRLDIDGQREEGFDAVWPITGTPDVQGGRMRVRDDSTLNHFTASSGQSIFRGDRLPLNLQGDLFICEPVGRLIRRAKVNNDNGVIRLSNAYQEAEFIASTDMNFRPVFTTTGPDGCLYIVDMHHGIIQEHEWTKEGSYLRPRILRLGLDKNIGRGRIYRLVHDDYTPGPQPQMLGQSSSKLVRYLNHPNGWWRDEAQKLLVARKDTSVVSALRNMALGKKSMSEKLFFWKEGITPLGQIHALWTLEGLDKMDEEVLFQSLKDKNAQVRKAAVWISEDRLREGDAEILEKLQPLAKDSSMDVRFQLFLSLRESKVQEAQKLEEELLADNRSNLLFAESWKSNRRARRMQDLRTKTAGMGRQERRLFYRGATIFEQLCSTCHGMDGKGTSAMVAPALAGRERINGSERVLINILLKGLTGPVDGKDYPDVMPAMEDQDDEWIASVISYIRNDMGNKASVVKPETVRKIRETTVDRKKPWTLKELADKK